MFSWPAISGLADNTPPGVFGLSPLSQTLIQAAYSFLSLAHNWTGADGKLTREEYDQMLAAVDVMLGETFMPVLIGSLVPYAGDDPPVATLICDGSIYQKNAYPALYDYLLGSPYIIDGLTFRTPNFSGRVIASENEDHSFRSEAGSDTHSLTENENAAHAHTYTPAVLNVDLESPGAPDVFAAGVGFPTLTGSSGLGSPHNNIQPTVYLRYAIVSGIALNVDPPTVETFFGDSAPTYGAISANAPGNAGLRFMVDAPGKVYGIRFYRPSGTANAQEGRMWNNDGSTLFGSGDFIESGDGWSYAPFDVPVDVVTGNTYMASIYAPSGQIPYSINYFNSSLVVGNLVAPADVVAGQRNGVYDTNSSPDFPNTGSAGINFYIDVRYVADE